jgi:2OG-Fe(II) oxygenase superfamily
MKNPLKFKCSVINAYFNKKVTINKDIVIIKDGLTKQLLDSLNKDLCSVKKWEAISVDDLSIAKDTTKMSFVENRETDGLIFKLAKEIMEMYSLLYPEVKSLIKGDQGYRYNLYHIGTGYYHHIDCSKVKNFYRERIVSCIIQLNSDYEGGMLEFPNQKFKIKLGAGDIVLFPSIHTHSHTVHPVTKGERKNIVTWFI